MWGGFNEAATDEALSFQARNPTPPKPPRATFWQQAGELTLAPVKGMGQAAAETGRKLGYVLDAYGKASAYGHAAADAVVMGKPAPDLAQVRTMTIDKLGDVADIDAAYRQSADSLKPDPLASSTASLILQDGVRLLSKVGMYAAAGGPAGAIFGTGLDEAGTGYLELREKGVDQATAAKAAAVRGVSTAVGVALPIAGRTGLQTLGLVAAGGPGSFMAEQALTREILESANYPELARQHDPFDLVGLGVATFLTGTIGAVAHRARGKVQPGQPELEPAPAPRAADLVADVPEVRKAAHVAYQAHVVDQHMLGERSDPRARAAHAEALQTAARAMEDGEPIRLGTLDMEPGRAMRVADELAQRLRAADGEIAAFRAAQASEAITEAPMPAVQALGAPKDVLDAGSGPAARIEPQMDVEPRTMPTAFERAEAIVRERPDLPVRMDEADTPAAARDLLDDVRHEIANEKADSRAFDAAITCFLRSGT